MQVALIAEVKIDPRDQERFLAASVFIKTQRINLRFAESCTGCRLTVFFREIGPQSQIAILPESGTVRVVCQDVD